MPLATASLCQVPHLPTHCLDQRSCPFLSHACWGGRGGTLVSGRRSTSVVEYKRRAEIVGGLTVSSICMETTHPARDRLPSSFSYVQEFGV
ncbi:hypothetical protein DPEC_G00164690 [Dallia pectoralis]|uniref:Uncharacterized protein n=1 Tax=Dallia pectoralis TaxID=75939 RepID=A0ACC2GHA7_DALPE|nr:hypothetical protein DPEC_G00164690 [Dallia pectoralis]